MTHPMNDDGRRNAADRKTAAVPAVGVESANAFAPYYGDEADWEQRYVVRLHDECRRLKAAAHLRLLTRAGRVKLVLRQAEAECREAALVRRLAEVSGLDEDQARAAWERRNLRTLAAEVARLKGLGAELSPGDTARLAAYENEVACRQWSLAAADPGTIDGLDFPCFPFDPDSPNQLDLPELARAALVRADRAAAQVVAAWDEAERRRARAVPYAGSKLPEPPVVARAARQARSRASLAAEQVSAIWDAAVRRNAARGPRRFQENFDDMLMQDALRWLATAEHRVGRWVESEREAAADVGRGDTWTMLRAVTEYRATLWVDIELDAAGDALCIATPPSPPA